MVPLAQLSNDRRFWSNLELLYRKDAVRLKNGITQIDTLIRAAEGPEAGSWKALAGALKWLQGELRQQKLSRWEKDNFVEAFLILEGACVQQHITAGEMERWQRPVEKLIQSLDGQFRAAGNKEAHTALRSVRALFSLMYAPPAKNVNPLFQLLPILLVVPSDRYDVPSHPLTPMVLFLATTILMLLSIVFGMIGWQKLRIVAAASTIVMAAAYTAHFIYSSRQTAVQSENEEPMPIWPQNIQVKGAQDETEATVEETLVALQKEKTRLEAELKKNPGDANLQISLELATECIEKLRRAH